ncbi:MAG TPA: hypothetical protein VHV82_15965 [Sporichthyaceae bacterium]|jgi:hypothetical protein|nr:hypothetical protein [Sporichthyaceae bacterium]
MAADERAVVRAAGAAARELRTVRDPNRHAHGDWNLGELGVHMLHVLDFELATVRGDQPPQIADFAALSRLTVDYVRAEPSRDPKDLADRIEARAAQYAAATEGRSAEAEFAWMGGTRLPLRTLHAHVISEMSVHSWDVAHAEGRSFVVPPDAALAALEDFVVPLVQAVGAAGSFGGPTAFVDQARGRDFRARYAVQVAGGSRRHFVFADGALHITDPQSGRPVDCRVWAEPSALLLVMWGRAGQWPAVARGRMRAWGRKPWLAMRLPSLLHTP